ncbi:hypothetical protein C8Q72DRAFT_812930 [Fomitopsis betulina]|nr:hypothetical protein C8Q72DRAFT_812930 [Fomitopsis betulina]
MIDIIPVSTADSEMLAPTHDKFIEFEKIRKKRRHPSDLSCMHSGTWYMCAMTLGSSSELYSSAMPVTKSKTWQLWVCNAPPSIVVVTEPSTLLFEVKDYLTVAHDVSVSLSTLLSTLNQLGLSRKVALKPAAERDEESWRAWREETAERFTADQLIFGDETSIDMRNLRRNYGRASVGFRAVQRYAQARGQRWSLVSVIARWCHCRPPSSFSEDPA